MFDLHQGFTNEEGDEQAPSAQAVAMAQLDAASALSKGRVRDAAVQQARAARLLGRLALARLRERLHKR